MENGGGLTIEDRIDGGGTHVLRGGWTLDPAWVVTPGEKGWRLTAGEQVLDVNVESAATLDLHVERVSYHPEYGVEFETQRLCWTFTGQLPVEVRTEVGAVQPS